VKCEEAARISFERAETLCRITNKRLDWYSQHENRIKYDLARDIKATEHVIANVLGDSGTFLDSLPKMVRVTPGASSTRARRASQPHRKVGIRGVPCTSSALPYLRALGALWGYKTMSFKVVTTNRVETVPKSWKTHRTIACEPDGNLPLQLALDTYVKGRLRILAVDLRRQDKNQSLARIGSINGSYATIDLSMASDTLSLNTAAWLLPIKWFKLFCDFRSPYGRGFGRLYKYAKLSSMGNGATFTLETLIFAAFCKAVIGGNDFAVYGDDLVVPTKFAPRILALLKFFGFLPNPSKSFLDGPFRESCGTDWYEGCDVTPFYVRCQNSMKIELCHLVNGLARLSWEGELWDALETMVVTENLPLVPLNESTVSGVWITPNDAYDQRLIRSHHGILQFRGFTPMAKKRRIDDSRTLFLWHLDASRRGDVSYQYLASHSHPFFYGNDLESDRQYDDKCIIRSRVPSLTHKYVRGWTAWRMPAQATPLYLFRWSDRLISRMLS
jgi:hypothetical protein